MKENNSIFQDYYGALYYIEENKDKKLTIFIVDDDLFYLTILNKKLTENSNFSVHTFSLGEDCLIYLSLKPDLVILDYHLNGKYTYAKNGAIIAQEIKEKSPTTETIIISSDQKLLFIDKLRTKVMFKDRKVFGKIETKFLNILKIQKEMWLQNAIFPSLIVATLIIVLLIFKNITV